MKKNTKDSEYFTRKMSRTTLEQENKGRAIKRRVINTTRDKESLDEIKEYIYKKHD